MRVGDPVGRAVFIFKGNRGNGRRGEGGGKTGMRGREGATLDGDSVGSMVGRSLGARVGAGLTSKSQLRRWTGDFDIEKNRILL